LERGVRYSAASLVLAAALALSLGGKLLANGTAPEADQDLFAARAEAALEAAGYRAVRDRRPFGILVHGRRGACRAMIGDYTPYGTFEDVFAQRAAPIGPLRFAWRGTISAEAPKLLPLGLFYLRREAVRVGLAVPRNPIAALALSPNCPAPDLTPLATLPA
jgi:hypothetical protein